METRRELKEELMNAEFRATTHFRKLQRIERILENADARREMYYMTLDKIKEVIAGN